MRPRWNLFDLRLAEKALVNLRYPLSACDELNLSKKFNTQIIKLTVGIHRQTWISGYPVFVDVHIENRSCKDVRKLELQLDKTIIFHDCSAPNTGSKSTDNLRLPDQMQKQNIANTQVSDGWQGVRALSQDFRTCQMNLPTGLVSIETGETSEEVFHMRRSFTFTQLTLKF